MQSLISGADCGPVNPLAQLSKAYGNDRSLQQDHYGPQAGPSTSGFRRATPTASRASAIEQDAQRFFSNTSPHARAHAHPHPHSQAFDLSPLNRALTPSTSAAQAPPAWAQAFSAQEHQPIDMLSFQQQQQQQAGPSAPAWANDFTRHQMRSDSPASAIARDHLHEQNPAAMARFQQQQQAYGGTHAMNMGMGVGMRMPMYSAAPMSMNAGPALHHQQKQQAPVLVDKAMATQWETAFMAQENATAEEAILSASNELKAANPSITDQQAKDALAQTAGALLNTVSSASERTDNTVNDKFAKSSFLDLMRKLRDGEVAVEGDKVVEQIASSTSASSFATREEEGRSNAGLRIDPSVSSGPALEGFAQQQHSFAEQQARHAALARQLGKDYNEMSSLWDDEDVAREARERSKGKGKAKMQFQGDGGMVVDEDNDGIEDGSFLLRDERTREQMYADTSVPLAAKYWEEEDFSDPSMIVGGHAFKPDKGKQKAKTAQQQEWEKLQDDWDQFEATSTGIKPVDDMHADPNLMHTSVIPEMVNAAATIAASGYAFAQHNPYAVETTRTHAMHSSAHQHQTTFDSVLEHEAAVQRDPTNSQAWLALGIKQQENEREEMAIKALRQALELDPSLGEAYLALAVSYTNENERSLSYEAIDKWIDSLGQRPEYTREVENYRNLFGPLPEHGHGQRHEYLTNVLIQLVQSKAEKNGADVDPDVQIGLGVLFNTSEEYIKASDCFGAALSARPNDPLLFNRLGATLANSGKTDLSIQYYLEALELHPAYVRARYNLAVANMNLGQHEQAIEHLLTSLMIQEEDAELQDNALAGGDGPGITSQNLWDTLSVALLMIHRSDLTAFASNRDLASLRQAFPSGEF